jgi:hypothetical protein
MAERTQTAFLKNDIPLEHVEELTKLKQELIFGYKRSYLYIDRVHFSGQTIEIGYLIFEYHPGNSEKKKGKFVFKEQQTYHCQPTEIKQYLEYFYNNSK